MASRVTAIWPLTSASSDMCANAGSAAAASSWPAEPSRTTPASSTLRTRRPWRAARAWSAAASPLTMTGTAARVGEPSSAARSLERRARCCADAGRASATSAAAAITTATSPPKSRHPAVHRILRLWHPQGRGELVPEISRLARECAKSVPICELERVLKKSAEVSQSETLTAGGLREGSEAGSANRPRSWPGGQWVGRSDPPGRGFGCTVSEPGHEKVCNRRGSRRASGGACQPLGVMAVEGRDEAAGDGLEIMRSLPPMALLLDGGVLGADGLPRPSRFTKKSVLRCDGGTG